jgi:tetratricopeptide (TPR) repeat protein
MYQRALAGHEKTLGLHHISTLRTVHNLGNLYKGQGKLKKAQDMYPEHARKHWVLITYPLSTVNNLGNLYKDQGKLKEAQDMYHRALVGREKALGPDHTSTISSIICLGNIYEDQGELGEAQRMYRRALAGYEEAGALDLDHTSVIHLPYSQQPWESLQWPGQAERQAEGGPGHVPSSTGSRSFIHRSWIQSITFEFSILYFNQGRVGQMTGEH